MSALHIGVIGSGENVPPGVLAMAVAIGRGIARRGGILVCGGRGGVMEAACRGAKEAGGLTLGLLPGLDRREANTYVDVVVPSGMGEMRNFLVVRASDALIMLQGEIGTLSEAVTAYQHGVPVVVVADSGGWAARLREAAPEGGAFLDTRRLVRLRYAASPDEAVDLAFQLAESRRR